MKALDSLTWEICHHYSSVMKTNCVFVFAVAMLALVNAESENQKLERFDRECRSADAISPGILCMYVKIGIMKSNGDINTNELKAALRVVIPALTNASIDDAVAICGETRSETAVDAAFALMACLKKHVKLIPDAKAENAMKKFHRIDKECQSVNDTTPHVLCMFVKTGLMKPNGDIDRNDLKAALKEVPYFPSALVDVVVDGCAERRGSTAAEAAEGLNECLMKFHNPTLHAIF